MNSRRVVMKDVAREAGVHQTTVSLALRNNPRIPESTRKKIQRIAKEMGYVPDPELNSLVSYRRSGHARRNPQTIAMIFDIEDTRIFNEAEYLPAIKAAAIERASELGYKIEIFVKGKDFLHSEMLNRVLLTRGIRGILFGAIHYQATQFELDWDEFSMVKINLPPYELAIDSVSANFVFSTRLVMRKIAEMGFQRPAMAVGRHDEYHARGLYSSGFLFGQKHFEAKNHIPFHTFDRKPHDAIVDEIRSWLLEVKPDVFVSTWNNLVEAAWKVTVEDGHNCRFIALEADCYTRAYGGTRHHHRQIARTAVEHLVGKMQFHQRGIPQHPSMTLIDSEWIAPGIWPPEAPQYFGCESKSEAGYQKEVASTLSKASRNRG